MSHDGYVVARPYPIDLARRQRRDVPGSVGHAPGQQDVFGETFEHRLASLSRYRASVRRPR